MGGGPRAVARNCAAGLACAVSNIADEGVLTTPLEGADSNASHLMLVTNQSSMLTQVSHMAVFMHAKHVLPNLTQ